MIMSSSSPAVCGSKKAVIQLGQLKEAAIISRPNRFVAIVVLEGREVRVHVADSGRLKELIYPGNTAMVRKVGDRADRLTEGDLVLASAGRFQDGSHRWVSVDTRYPNKLFRLALENRCVKEFAQYTEVHPEFYYNHEKSTSGPRSRLDFMLRGVGLPQALIEVKSVTLCVDGVGFFPDAPTSRGARHLNELGKAVSQGYRAYAVFMAQRHDIREIRPNAKTDPKFALALKEAREKGVGLLGFRCHITPEQMVFDGEPIPVRVE